MPDDHDTEIFISYARTDTNFVDRLNKDLRANGFHTWMDRNELDAGTDWYDAVQEALDSSRLILVVVSPDSLDSKYVHREYRYAIQADKPIIPLLYRPGGTVPFELNSLQWINFEGESRYQPGLHELFLLLARLGGKPSEPTAVSAGPPVSSTAEAPDKLAVLQSISRQFMLSVAEQEFEHLPEYFVETDAWSMLLDGDTHVIKGVKGSGKSALYQLLLKQSDALLQHGNILVVQAEEPLGAPAFRGALELWQSDESRMPASGQPVIGEREFATLWKLYFLALVGVRIQQLSEQDSRVQSETSVVEFLRALKGWNLLPEGSGFSLRSVLNAVIERVGLRLSSGRASGEAEPIHKDVTIVGQSTVLDLLRLAESALAGTGLSAWIILDRLDDTFSGNDSALMEQHGLRGLIRTFLDLQGYRHIRLKLFVRSDLDQRVTTMGTTRLSDLDHVGPDFLLTWRSEQLLSLIIRRLILSKSLCSFYGLDAHQISVLPQDYQAQLHLFYSIFPRETKSQASWEWILDQLRDGNGLVAPRDLIRFMGHAVRSQLDRRSFPPVAQLLDVDAMQDASENTSKDHYARAFSGEFPTLLPLAEDLRRRRIDHTLSSLHRVWSQRITDLRLEEARRYAQDLSKAAFFGIIENERGPDSYQIAPLYRSALGVRPGQAT